MRAENKVAFPLGFSSFWLLVVSADECFYGIRRYWPEFIGNQDAFARFIFDWLKRTFFQLKHTEISQRRKERGPIWPAVTIQIRAEDSCWPNCDSAATASSAITAEITFIFPVFRGGCSDELRPVFAVFILLGWKKSPNYNEGATRFLWIRRFCARPLNYLNWEIKIRVVEWTASTLASGLMEK